MEVLRHAVRAHREGRAGALATVIAVSGSVPRHPGARLWVGAAAETVGTIGGGRVELAVTEAAAKVARCELGAHRQTHHLVRDLAMCCGGRMEFWIEPVAPSTAAIEEALSALAARRPVTLATPLGGGPKYIEAEPPAKAGLEIGGELLREALWPPERLVIFGCGHVGRALGPLAREVGFEVVLCDDNETGQVDVRPPWADELVTSFSAADVERAVGPLGGRDYLVVLTRDHAVDEALIERFLPRIAELAYLGVIASAGKAGRFRRRLAARGVASDERWAALRAPIGLDIAAETPSEIAVSIVAELVSLRNRRRMAARW